VSRQIQKQITICLPVKLLDKTEGLMKRLAPLVATRADLLRMIFELGMEEVEKTAQAYARDRAKRRRAS
jgi:hypothetical protein